MSSPNSERPAVAKLYRRFTRSRAATAPLPEADTLLALADGLHSEETERLLADVARSGLHADLLRFTRALAPESARLGVELEQALERPGADHARRGRLATHAAPRRGWLRVAAGVAAGLIVAVAVFSVQRTQSPAAPNVAATTIAKTDRIFAALNDRGSARARGDRIFSGDFKTDEIFKASGG